MFKSVSNLFSAVCVHFVITSNSDKLSCRIVDLALFASRSVVAQRPLLGPALLVAPFGSSS